MHIRHSNTALGNRPNPHFGINIQGRFDGSRVTLKSALSVHLCFLIIDKFLHQCSILYACACSLCGSITGKTGCFLFVEDGGVQK